MKKNHPSRTMIIKRIIFLILVICLIGTSLTSLSNRNRSFFLVTAQENEWILPLHFAESSGREATIVMKGSINASEGQDNLDIPIPPPPMPPYLRAWFATPFSIPFNNLLNESKRLPSNKAIWNISVIWVPEVENASTTTITISWDPTLAQQSTYDSVQLYERNTSVANMYIDNHYTFPTNGSIHHFQVIAQNTPDISGEDQLPILPITIIIIVLVLAIIIALYWYKRKY